MNEFSINKQLFDNYLMTSVTVYISHSDYIVSKVHTSDCKAGFFPSSLN